MDNSDPYSGSTENTEYKSDVPSEFQLARDIAAFANTNGGEIYIGYVPTEEGIRYGKGLTDMQVQAAIEVAKETMHSLSPEPHIDILQDNISGSKQFVIVTVQKSPKPVLFEANRYFVRRGNTTTLAEEEFIQSLSKSVPSIYDHLITTVISNEKHEINREAEAKKFRLHEINREADPEKFRFKAVHIGGLEAFNLRIEENIQLNLNDLLKVSIQRTHEDLTAQSNERILQARMTFIVALVLLILAIILVFVGVILIFTNKLQAGVVSSVASIVSGIVCTLALAFYKQTNERLDEYVRELVALEKSYTAMQCISYITDIKLRDEAICELTKNISMGSLAHL